MRCTSCGAEIAPNSMFCTQCGSTVENSNQSMTNNQVSLAKAPEQQYQQQQNPYQQQQYQQNPYQQQQYQQQYQQPNYANNSVNNIPYEYKPIGAWGYIGYNLLFAIPLVGLIMLFVFGFGGTGNINVKNYARSFLLLYLITIIFTILWFLFLAGIFGLTASEFNY